MAARREQRRRNETKQDEDEDENEDEDEDEGNGLQHGLLFKDLTAGPQMQASPEITCGWRP